MPRAWRAAPPLLAIAAAALLCGAPAARALLGPGGQECSTPRECKILSARARAVAKEKKAAANSNGEQQQQQRNQQRQQPHHGSVIIDNAGRAETRRKRKPSSRAGDSSGRHGGDPTVKHTARFACAVVVVSGPNGLRFQNEGHVQRFRDYAKGCVVYVSAAPHFRRRALAIAGAQNVRRSWVLIITRLLSFLMIALPPPPRLLISQR